jgi:hypothetical protein
MKKHMGSKTILTSISLKDRVITGREEDCQDTSKITRGSSREPKGTLIKIREEVSIKLKHNLSFDYQSNKDLNIVLT